MYEYYIDIIFTFTDVKHFTEFYSESTKINSNLAVIHEIEIGKRLSILDILMTRRADETMQQPITAKRLGMINIQIPSSAVVA